MSQMFKAFMLYDKRNLQLKVSLIPDFPHSLLLLFPVLTTPSPTPRSA